MDVDSAENAVKVEQTDDSCRLKIIEVVSLARETDDGSCTLRITKIVSLARDTDDINGNYYTEVEEENLESVKQEPEDVCCFIFVIFNFS